MLVSKQVLCYVTLWKENSSPTTSISKYLLILQSQQLFKIIEKTTKYYQILSNTIAPQLPDNPQAVESLSTLVQTYTQACKNPLPGHWKHNIRCEG